MSAVRQSPRSRIVLVLALVAAAIAACDARATAPADLRRATAAPAAVEGDTLKCQRGWVIINNFYVCNEDL